MCEDTEVLQYAKITTLGKARIHSTTTPLAMQESRDSLRAADESIKWLVLIGSIYSSTKQCWKKELFSAFSAAAQVVGFKL